MKHKHKRKIELPALSIAIEGAATAPLDVVAFKVEESLLVFQAGVIVRQVDRALKVDSNILEIGHRDNRLEVVGGAFGERDSTAALALSERVYDVARVITSARALDLACGGSVSHGSGGGQHSENARSDLHA